MKKIILLVIALFVLGFGYSSIKIEDTKTDLKASYIQSLESDNNISYDKILNTRGAYITSMCYTKTKDDNTGMVSNPCYSCHTRGREPNYFNDTSLQKNYNFPLEVRKNRFSNLFKDRSTAVKPIDDEKILKYIRQTNYFDKNGNIILADRLPKDWAGYRPDSYFNFDEEGFDRDKQGDYTLWRAFRYYPFLGTFWPTNGSTDDVMIRLDDMFAKNSSGIFDYNIYKMNLSIVEALIKQKDINLSYSVDEADYNVDLNQNGIIDRSNVIAISSYDKMSYVGLAKEYLEEAKVHLAPGLFPEGTEFLHSVRYVDWDNSKNKIKMSNRLKELRYAKKVQWKTYSEIQRVSKQELWEAQTTGDETPVMTTIRGDYEKGLKNNIGWIYQGFIEDKNGGLRPQTHEESIGCMGCHSRLGATTDSVFAFARKFEGNDKSKNDYGWNHWNQKDLVGVKEQVINYQNHGDRYEYSFYLQNNHSANEFRNNDEVKDRFFDANGTLKENMLDKLHNDISELLYPSKDRALALNKAYKVMVEEQSFIYGRDANVKPMKNVFKEIRDGQKTDILKSIVQ